MSVRIEMRESWWVIDEENTRYARYWKNPGKEGPPDKDEDIHSLKWQSFTGHWCIGSDGFLYLLKKCGAKVIEDGKRRYLEDSGRLMLGLPLEWPKWLELP